MSVPSRRGGTDRRVGARDSRGRRAADRSQRDRSERGRSQRGRAVRGGAVAGSGTGAVRWMRRWILPLGLAVITVLTIAVYFTPLLGVRSVEVVGATTLQEDRITDTASIRMGTPMVRLDKAGIRDRLRRIPEVESVRVERSWPSTVKLRISERTPVVFASTDAGFRLVDTEGVPFETVPRPPEGLPELRVGHVAPGDPATQAAMTALTSLSEPLRDQVTAVVAEAPDNVVLRLTEGREVQWGSPRMSERKAAILPPLLTRPGEVYDVTSPALPTVS
ncbi:cell division protein FtsQ [Halopolyspora algeriensis]|uniref:Cell division protein FtsQ n=1 Tax=Halopolyspora algeriensis TaxID=1500506 RepID=A0A368VP25_9ACTN|nr:FtsQ-type POTRA domain-containing protein [Halopolyspora algeriensis]RCW43270.1 cell division protein FtsQ [Halopolyspora algeriensis]TQM56329.1 cell division protein FtsQ [Halopolyspora algeriensis]